jgi:ribosomal protein S18 acetylase RimI-like enzyme
MSFQIRFCEPNDFSAILNLLKQLWPDLLLDADALHMLYSSALLSPSQKLIAGVVDGHVVGFCSLSIKNNFWQAGKLGTVDELVVDVNHRGRGLGKQLMDSITQIAIDSNCKRIELESSFHRTDAHRFYESIGFKSRAYWFTKILEENET